MKTHEIIVGGEYVAKVGGKLTTVRVDCINEVVSVHQTSKGLRSVRFTYSVINLNTGRELVFKSARRFRAPANEQTRKLADKVFRRWQVARDP